MKHGIYGIIFNGREKKNLAVYFVHRIVGRDKDPHLETSCHEHPRASSPPLFSCLHPFGTAKQTQPTNKPTNTLTLRFIQKKSFALATSLSITSHLWNFSYPFLLCPSLWITSSFCFRLFSDLKHFSFSCIDDWSYILHSVFHICLRLVSSLVRQI